MMLFTTQSMADGFKKREGDLEKMGKKRKKPILYESQAKGKAITIKKQH